MFALRLVESFRMSLSVACNVTVVVETLRCVYMAFRNCLQDALLSPVDLIFAGSIADQALRRQFGCFPSLYQDSTDLRTEWGCEFWTRGCGAPTWRARVENHDFGLFRETGGNWPFCDPNRMESMHFQRFNT